MSVREFISSSPSHQFIVVYRDEVVIARFEHCQRIFVPSDPGVPRTFVVDCRPVMFCGEKLQTKMQNYIEYFLLLIFTFGSAKTEKVKKRNKLWQN